MQEIMTSTNTDLDNTTVLMNNIRLAKNELLQEYIDFYRPVCNKEVLEDI